MLIVRVNHQLIAAGGHYPYGGGCTLALEDTATATDLGTPYTPSSRFVRRLELSIERIQAALGRAMSTGPAIRLSCRNNVVTYEFGPASFDPDVVASIRLLILGALTAALETEATETMAFVYHVFMEDALV